MAPPPAPAAANWTAPAAPPAMSGAAARPTGITILAVLAGIGGVFLILGGIAAVGLGGLAGSSSGSAVIGGFVAFFGILFLILGVVYLAFAYGAWTLKRWAWTLGIAGQVVSLALAALNAVSGNGVNIVGILISVAILYYLWTPAVKAAFGRA
jgi:hypothetical protein